MLCTGVFGNQCNPRSTDHDLNLMVGSIMQLGVTSVISNTLRVAARSQPLMSVAMMIAEFVSTTAVFIKQGACCSNLSRENLLRRHIAEFVIGVPVGAVVGTFFAWMEGFPLAFGHALITAAVCFVALRLLIVAAEGALIAASKRINFILN